MKFQTPYDLTHASRWKTALLLPLIIPIGTAGVLLEVVVEVCWWSLHGLVKWAGWRW